MNNRIELNNEELEGVAGGRFNYYPQNDGTYLVQVDGVAGSWHCKQSDKSTVTGVIGRNAGTMSPAEIVSLLVSQGLYY